MESENIVQLGKSETKPTVDDVRLKDGSPLYHALIEESPAGVLNKEEAQHAKALVNQLFIKFPKEVQDLNGKPPEEALVALKELIVKLEREEETERAA